VKIFRQAISIDERRRMFRLKPWKPDQTYMRNRYSLTNNAEPQDSLQVWFAGVHGRYRRRLSGEGKRISKYPLIWMIDEAVAHGSPSTGRPSITWPGASSARAARSATCRPRSTARRTIR